MALRLLLLSAAAGSFVAANATESSTTTTNETSTTRVITKTIVDTTTHSIASHLLFAVDGTPVSEGGNSNPPGEEIIVNYLQSSNNDVPHFTLGARVLEAAMSRSLPAKPTLPQLPPSGVPAFTESFAKRNAVAHTPTISQLSLSGLPIWGPPLGRGGENADHSLPAKPTISQLPVSGLPAFSSVPIQDAQNRPSIKRDYHPDALAHHGSNAQTQNDFRDDPDKPPPFFKMFITINGYDVEVPILQDLAKDWCGSLAKNFSTVVESTITTSGKMTTKTSDSGDVTTDTATVTNAPKSSQKRTKKESDTLPSLSMAHTGPTDPTPSDDTPSSSGEEPVNHAPPTAEPESSAAPTSSPGSQDEETDAPSASPLNAEPPINHAPQPTGHRSPTAEPASSDSDVDPSTDLPSSSKGKKKTSVTDSATLPSGSPDPSNDSDAGAASSESSYDPAENSKEGASYNSQLSKMESQQAGSQSPSAEPATDSDGGDDATTDAANEKRAIETGNPFIMSDAPFIWKREAAKRDDNSDSERTTFHFTPRPHSTPDPDPDANPSSAPTGDDPNSLSTQSYSSDTAWWTKILTPGVPASPTDAPDAPPTTDDSDSSLKPSSNSPKPTPKKPKPSASDDSPPATTSVDESQGSPTGSGKANPTASPSSGASKKMVTSKVPLIAGFAIAVLYSIVGLWELVRQTRRDWHCSLVDCACRCIGLGLMKVWWPVKDHVN